MFEILWKESILILPFMCKLIEITKLICALRSIRLKILNLSKKKKTPLLLRHPYTVLFITNDRNKKLC